VAAKADNRAVFVGADFLLLSSEKDYSIPDYHDMVGRDRLTDSLNS
jgi:hypothetical protein